MCECCWRDKCRRECSSFHEVAYSDVKHEHEKRGCLCTKLDTEEGRKRAAGDYWDDERKCDSREKAGGK